MRNTRKNHKKYTKNTKNCKTSRKTKGGSNQQDSKRKLTTQPESNTGSKQPKSGMSAFVRLGHITKILNEECRDHHFKFAYDNGLIHLGNMVNQDCYEPSSKSFVIKDGSFTRTIIKEHLPKLIANGLISMEQNDTTIDGYLSKLSSGESFNLVFGLCELVLKPGYNVAWYKALIPLMDLRGDSVLASYERQLTANKNFVEQLNSSTESSPTESFVTGTGDYNKTHISIFPMSKLPDNVKGGFKTAIEPPKDNVGTSMVLSRRALNTLPREKIGHP